jgi:hypothetical protein
MQHRLFFALLLTSVVVAAPTISSAERLSHGTFEWSIAGSGSRTNFDYGGKEDGDSTRVAMGMELGYFITPVFEVAVSTGGTHTSIEPQGKARKKFDSFNLGTRILANVPNESAVTPYAYLGAGVVSFSGAKNYVGSQATTVWPSMGIGARYFLGKKVSFNIQFDYTQYKNYEGFKDQDAKIITWSFGFSTFLRRK